jgi:hypothetical protein
MATIERLRKNPKVRDAYREIDGDETTYWVHLNSGWSSPTDPGSLHTIHERTAREVAQQVKDAPRCECADCREQAEEKAFEDAEASYVAKLCDAAASDEEVTAIVEYYAG